MAHMPHCGWISIHQNDIQPLHFILQINFFVQVWLRNMLEATNHQLDDALQTQHSK